MKKICAKMAKSDEGISVDTSRSYEPFAAKFPNCSRNTITQ